MKEIYLYLVVQSIIEILLLDIRYYLQDYQQYQIMLNKIHYLTGKQYI